MLPSKVPPSDRDAGEDDPLERYDLYDAAGHLLRRCQQRAVDIFMEEVGDDGVRPRQFALMYVIYRNPGLNQSDLVRLTGIDRSTVADIVARLIRRGYIRRERAAKDQRANRLWLAPSGTAVLREAAPHVARVHERILEPIPPALRGTFMQCMRILADLPGNAPAVPDAEPERDKAG